jgi:hypothetical protein
MFTPCKAVPRVVIETLWRDLVKLTFMEPVTGPVIDSLIALSLADPVAVPEALKVRSSQLPERRPPL